MNIFCTGIAQLAEHQTPNLGVAGSSPASRAILITMIPAFMAVFLF